MSPRRDLNCQKFNGTFLGLFGTLMAMSALLTFEAACIKNLPSEVPLALANQVREQRVKA